MDLRGVHVEAFATAWRCDAIIVDKTTADLEENFNSVDEKENDDYEQENGITAVEDTVQGILIAEEIGGENLKGKTLKKSYKGNFTTHLSSKETVWKKIER